MTVEKETVKNKFEIWIPGRLPGLNEIIASAKSSHGKFNAYSRMKKTWVNYISKIIQECNLPKMQTIHLTCIFIERTRKRDQDNISAGGKKLIADSLITAGVIPNDGWRNIKWGEDLFRINKFSPGVKIIIRQIAKMKKAK